MDFIRKHKDAILNIIGIGIFILGLFAVIFYIYKRCRSEYNADFTDTLLWANASVTSGHFYDPDYWYAYFLPFSGIPIMIPIVAMFGLTYFSHQLGMTVFVIIFAIALLLFFRACGCRSEWIFAMTGLVLIFMCASSITRMIFYGHIIHYSLAIVFMCFAFALLKGSSLWDGDSKNGKKYTVAIAVFCMLCTTNGVATCLLFFVPFAGSMILERYLDKKPISVKEDRNLFCDLAIICGGGLVGIIIKMIFFSSSAYEDSITALLPSDGWVWKQSPFLLEWIKVLTDDSNSDVLMQSFDGIRILSMYTLALILLVVPFIALISYRKIQNRMVRLLVLFYTIMFATTMLSYSVSYALVSNWRLAGLVCCALIVTLMFVYEMLKTRQYVRWYILLVPVFAVFALICLLTVKAIPSALNANETDQLIEIYRQNNLTRGYATSFWNSTNSANVLSDGEITVAPITLHTDGSYEVRHYQSEPSEYEDDPSVDRYFVVVDGQDMEYGADTLGANRVDEIKFQDGMYIWIYDRNIFENLEPVFKPAAAAEE